MISNTNSTTNIKSSPSSSSLTSTSSSSTIFNGQKSMPVPIINNTAPIFNKMNYHN